MASYSSPDQDHSTSRPERLPFNALLQPPMYDSTPISRAHVPSPGAASNATQNDGAAFASPFLADASQGQAAGGLQACGKPPMLQQGHQWVQQQATVSISAKPSTLMKVCLVSDGDFSCVRFQGLLLLTI